MKNPTLTLTHPQASRERLLAFVREVPGGLCRYKDSGFIADTKGSASSMDNRHLRLDAPELECWNAQGKRRRLEVIGTQTKTRSAWPLNRAYSSKMRGASGEVSLGIRAKSLPWGWSNSGCAPKTLIGDKIESSSGPSIGCTS